MGGGRKKDRTKGSAKPSSSARSAELLSNSSEPIGFGDLGSTSILESLVIGDDVPSELKVVFKKLTKKDEVTRLKAIEEFNKIMNASGITYVEKILPYWPRTYSKIANDHSRRIRTGAQEAHLLVVKYSGRDLAPQLKSLAPTWFISCSDPHAPAASSAVKSFALAFSTEKKMKDAVCFCLMEIMSSIEENLLLNSIQTFKDESLSVEDAENKYYRVVSSSLLAYASILDYLNEADAKKIASTKEKLIESPKFWKYAKNKNVMIRSSWFRLICKMSEKSQELSLFEDETYKKLIDLLFSNLEESDPVVAPIIWDCCLFIMLNFSKWTTCVDLHGAVLPQIYHYLEGGAQGSGSDIYPKLLPFLSCLSKNDLSSDEFHSRILTSLRSPANSLKKQQLKALLNSYFELCRYFEKLRGNDYIVSDVFVWLELALVCNECDVISRDLFDSFLSSYLVYNQSTTHWERTKQLTREALEKNNFNGLNEFLRSLSNVQKSSEKKKSSITFAGDESQELKGDSKKLNSSELTQIAADVCYYCVFEIKWDECDLDLIAYTIRSFGGNKNFFESLMRDQNDAEGHSGVLSFIRKLSTMNKSQAAADLIVTSSFFLNRPEDILNFHFSIVCSDSNDNEWFSQLMHGFTFIMDKEDRHLSLFRSNKFEDKFITCVKWAINSILSGAQNENDATWLMIQKFCVDNGKYLSDKAIEIIILEFIKCLNDLTSSEKKLPTSKKLIMLSISSILEALVCVQNFEFFLRLVSRKDILLSLFRISCSGDLEPNGDVQLKIMDIWVEALTHLVRTDSVELHGQMDSFLKDICNIAYDMVIQSKTNHVNDGVSRLLRLISSEQQKIVFNRILEEEWKALNVNFPSKELLFERKIFPSRVLEIDFIDFENEQTRRKRILEFFWSLTSDLCNLMDGRLDEDLMKNLTLMIYYQCSLKFDKSVANEGRRFDIIILSLMEPEQQKLFQFVINKSKMSGGLWSLVLDTIADTFEGRLKIRGFENEEADLNHKEIIIERMEMEDTLQIVSYFGDKLYKLKNHEVVHCLTLASRLISKVAKMEDFAKCCFDAIKIKRDEVDFLFSCDIGEMNWEELLPTLAVIEFFDSYLEIIESHSERVDSERWVFILCFASSWIQTVDESKNTFSSRIEVQRFALPLFRLLEKIGSSLNALSGQEDWKNLYEEWKEFFSGGIYDVILRLFVTISHNDIHQEVIDALNGALRHIPLEILHEGAGLPPKFCEEDVDMEKIKQLPENLIFLLNHLGPLVLSPNPSVQTTASHLLLKLMSKISELESQRSEKTNTLPHRIIYLLNITEPIVKNIFDEFKFGEPVIINDSVDGSLTAYLRAYLYTCRLILQLVANANQELRPSWTEFIRERQFLDILVPILFFLMRIDEPEARQYADDNCTDIQKIAFNIYHDLLKFLPAMFRHWWNAVDHRVSKIIEQFTIKFVSPLLWEEESQNIISSKTTFKNMTVGVRTSVREVVAVYSLDEGSMDLIISLPNNFPLGPIVVDRSKRIGVGYNQWRKWILQLTTFLEQQNGSILEGLIIWKNNVDKRFEGVEECCICFYILHGANHTLPKLTCRTCRKKFHSACLYKWFSTSNNSTCPLCRNLF